MPDDFMEKLNEEQKAAVLATEGYVRVLAGAGTGKTRALTSRYCYLVSKLGVAPKNILCVTFTNRAANEMKSRVRSMLGDNLDLGYVCTIHAFCVQLLREDVHVLHFPKEFLILDTEDEKDILERVFEDMHLTLRDTTIKRTIDEVLEGKKMQTESYIDDFYLLNNDELKARFAAAKDRDEEIFLRYLYEQKKCFGLDFNDLINFASYILKNFPDIRAKWQDRMEYVMIDEFQDVSLRQYTIAQVLSGKHKNLFIVGDPDQTIYTWRGSHMHLFLDFDKKFPDAKTIVLDANYRSTPEILKAADCVISNNKLRYPKKLRAVRPGGKKPLYFHAKSEKEEAEWISGEILTLKGEGIPYGRIGVLYRAHYLSRALEEAFIKEKIPYRIFSGVEFYGRREIRDMVCFLRMLTDGDDNAFLRTVNLPSRKIGKKKLEFLREYSELHGKSLYDSLKDNLENEIFEKTGAKSYAEAVESVRLEVILQEEAVAQGLMRDPDREAPMLSDILQMVLDRTGYESYLRLQGDQERLDNEAEFKRAVADAGQDCDTTLRDFLGRIALFTNLDQEEKADTVKLMTVHTAKGMEYPCVFLCGLNEGVFPSRKVLMPDDMDEERRLAYVAMTRAKDRLYLSDSEGVTNDGVFKYPSRFIFEAGLENIECVTEPDREIVERSTRFIRQDEEKLEKRRNLFEEGSRVRHEVFGPGTVLKVEAGEGYYVIKFDSLNTERNLQFSAPLQGLTS
jgi:DNA helicase-2/ATP-dependent DNA helicase PcrA